MDSRVKKARNLVAASNTATHRKTRLIPPKKGKGAMYKRIKKFSEDSDTPLVFMKAIRNV